MRHQRLKIIVLLFKCYFCWIMLNALPCLSVLCAAIFVLSFYTAFFFVMLFLYKDRSFLNSNSLRPWLNIVHHICICTNVYLYWQYINYSNYISYQTHSWRERQSDFYTQWYHLGPMTPATIHQMPQHFQLCQLLYNHIVMTSLLQTHLENEEWKKTILFLSQIKIWYWC